MDQYFTRPFDIELHNGQRKTMSGSIEQTVSKHAKAHLIMRCSAISELDSSAGKGKPADEIQGVDWIQGTESTEEQEERVN